MNPDIHTIFLIDHDVQANAFVIILKHVNIIIALFKRFNSCKNRLSLFFIKDTLDSRRKIHHTLYSFQKSVDSFGIVIISYSMQMYTTLVNFSYKINAASFID